jgi:hypothetical protein
MRAASAIDASLQEMAMTFRPFSLAPMLMVALATSACEAPSYLRVASTSDRPMISGAEGIVHTSPSCGDDNGGFGALVRHHGEPTPWSENPFNGCGPL